MNLFSFLPPESFATVYYLMVLLLCVGTAVAKSASDGNAVLHANKRWPVLPIVLMVALASLMAYRPLTMGDTSMYRHVYENFMPDPRYLAVGGTETLWGLLGFGCCQLGLSYRDWFLVVAMLYMGFTLVACWRLFPNNVWLSLLFCVASFSFWSYGTNGVRNGLATAMVMCGLTFLLSAKWVSWAVGWGLMLLATQVHNSVTLPAAVSVVAVVLWRKPQWAIRMWLLAIPVSLVTGNMLGNMFGGFVEDDRYTKYFLDQNNMDVMGQFSRTGFRWDFLLYSALPVFFTWYLTVKRNFQDRAFNIIAITYILANAFWILVIRASFSNRFAYLSWFLFPLVIAYPLLRFHIWEDQDRKTATVLLLYEAFSFIMFLLGK